MKIIGVCFVFSIILLLASCQYTPSPNVYESDSFNNRPDSNTRYNVSDSNGYETPIVGIFHPHNEDEIEVKSNQNDEDIYEPTSDTEIEPIETGDSLLVRIDTLIENNELSKARKIISKTILNKDLASEEEDALINKLRSINSILLTSTDEDGDCKLVTIEKGQTLYAITKENNMSVEAIAALNNMDPNKYNAGQKIKIYKHQFHIISIVGRNYIYLWQNDHIVERYNAKINDIKKGIYRLKGKKKGSLGEMVFTQNLLVAPESKDLTSEKTIKVQDNDYQIINMLLVSNSLLDIK